MAAYALRATATNSLGWWFGVICALIGLAVAEPVLSAENEFDGVYTGKRLLTKGPTRSACRPKMSPSSLRAIR